MSSMVQVRHSLNRLWDNLAEGWQDLRERASHAMTRFSPTHRNAPLQTSAERLLRSASRWGLLAAEIREDKDKVVVKLEVPGMETEDFDLSIADDQLIIRGEKKVRHQQGEGHDYALECAYGRFERSLPLPAAVDDRQAKAKYKWGVLTVTLPKTRQYTPRRIAIKSR